MRLIDLLTRVAALGNRLRGLTRRTHERADLEDELRFHRDQLAADLQRTGVGATEARRQASARLGGVAQWVEAGADAWRLGALEAVTADLRVALRQWRRTPMATAVAVVSIAVGVGFNTGMSSLVNAAILRPLPVPDPATLRVVNLDGDPTGSWIPWPLMERLRVAARPGLELAGVTQVRDLSLERDGVASLTPRGGSLVSDNYFDMLALQPTIGRLFHPGDEDEGTADHLVVLSHAFWQSTFGSDASIVGRALRFNGVPMQVIGVAPAGFFGTQAGAAPDAFFLLTADDALLHRDVQFRRERTNWWVQAIGRASREAAPVTPALTATVRAFRTELEGPDASADTRQAIAAIQVSLDDGRSGFGALRAQYAQPLRLLWGLSLLVLLIALVNVATLLLGRLRARDREFAVRRAIGASRGQMARQVALEGTLLAAVGTALALVVLRLAGPAARAWLFPAAARLQLDFGADARVALAVALSFLVSLVMLAAIPAGVVIRWHRRTRTSAGDGRTAGRASAGRVLSATQCALALPLVVTALLLARTMHELRQVPLGFAGDDVTLVRLDATRNDYAADQRVAAYRAAMAAVRVLPGVRAVSITRHAPLSGAWSGNSFRVEGSREPDVATEPARVQVMYVDPEYFRAVRAPVLAGREFMAADAPRGRGVVVVSEQFARRHYGSAQGAIGRRLARGEGAYTIEIVGVAANARLQSVRDAGDDVVYQPYLADASNVALASLVVAADRPAELLGPVLREAIRGADPRLEVLGVTPFTRYVERSIEVERMVGRLSAVLAVLATLLAAFGVYGVFSDEVHRRGKDIGVRLALGATPATVRRWILASAGRVFLLGLLLGLPAAALTVRAARSLLYEVTTADPLALGGAGVVFAAAFLLAALGPSARAARLDPLTSLRAD